MIKDVKFGYGTVIEQLMICINDGLISREDAFELVKKYDGKCHQRYIDMFCKYLDITEREFWQVVEGARGRHVWRKSEEGEWGLIVEDPVEQSV